LNSTDPDFFDNLAKLSKELKVTTMFDTLGGELPGEMLNSMPEESLMICLGNFTNLPVSYNSNDLRW
jgi:hypothetical protein